MFRFLYSYWSKKSLYKMVARELRQVTRKINYDYEYYVDMGIISEVDYTKLTTSPKSRGKTVLEDLKSKYLDSNDELEEIFLDRLVRKIYHRQLLAITALGLTLTISLLFTPWMFIGLAVLLYIQKSYRVALFFSDQINGTYSKTLLSLISKIKVEQALKLRIKALNQEEWGEFIASYPEEVISIASTLRLDGSYEYISEIIQASKRLSK